MNVFQTQSGIIDDYATYIRSFLNIADPTIREVVEGELSQGKLWPEPLLQFNPSFEIVSTVTELANTGTLHPDIADIFTGYSLYRHQVEAIKLGAAGKDFIVTSGTGSGKSLTYIGAIFHHLLCHPQTPGVTAVVVYPMNALINSQFEEFDRYRENYENASGRPFPITFGQYTGQERETARQQMRENPPQILLTNYIVKADVIKRRSYKDQAPRPNAFFREMYGRDFSTTKRLRAEDHTAQLGTDERQDREDRFRAEWYLDDARTQLDVKRIRSASISALFCSPTMELGIDIGGLSVVHLRNAPPNPANYAQRSGRAGRSGQGALVFTYCSSYSPHDRHYFQQQAELVAGVVQAPRLDLCNRELLLTHLNALAVSAIGLPGLEEQGGTRPSILRLVVDDHDQMPLALEVRSCLHIPPGIFDGLYVQPDFYYEPRI